MQNKRFISTCVISHFIIDLILTLMSTKIDLIIFIIKMNGLSCIHMQFNTVEKNRVICNIKIKKTFIGLRRISIFFLI